MFMKMMSYCVIEILAVCVCVNATRAKPLSSALWVMQSYFSFIDADLSCPALRRPRVVRQKAKIMFLSSHCLDSRIFLSSLL